MRHEHCGMGIASGGALAGALSSTWRAAVTAHESRNEMANDKLTITLTARNPVTIVKNDWPVIASSAHTPGEMRNGTPVPDHETDTHKITVRQHADGRTLVYGVLSASTAWTSTESWRGGELLGAGDDIAAAILRVGEAGGLTERCIRECVADLPADEI